VSFRFYSPDYANVHLPHPTLWEAFRGGIGHYLEIDGRTYDMAPALRTFAIATARRHLGEVPELRVARLYLGGGLLEEDLKIYYDGLPLTGTHRDMLAGYTVSPDPFMAAYGASQHAFALYPPGPDRHREIDRQRCSFTTAVTLALRRTHPLAVPPG
jgi:hypothetical protein